MASSSFSWVAAFATVVAYNSASSDTAVLHTARAWNENGLGPDFTGRVLSILLSVTSLAATGGFVVGLNGAPQVRRTKGETTVAAPILPPRDVEVTLYDGVKLALPVIWIVCVLLAIIGGKFKFEEPTFVTRRCISLMEKLQGVKRSHADTYAPEIQSDGTEKTSPRLRKRK